METEEFMITTIDNPYNPFTEAEKWVAFDEEKGYYTCQYLARIAKTTTEMTDEDRILITNDAIDEILKNDFLGLYMKVTENDRILHREGGT